MNQFDFNQLLEKYLDGRCSEQEEKIVLEWYKTTNELENNSLSEDEKEETKQRIWGKVKAHTVDERPVLSLKIGKYLAIAAAFLLLIWAGTSLFQEKEIQKASPSVSAAENNSTVIDIKNTSQKPQEVTLEDGSIVVLQPQSIFSYPEHFGIQNRTVYLTGEALFKIKRNPTKPFLVHAGNLVTEVLGTSFIVKSNDNSKTTEVSVLSGTVSVYENAKQELKNKNGVILTPNHKVTYHIDTKQLISTIVEQPIIVNDLKPTTAIDFTFEDTRLPIVLDLLKKRYALDFIVENDNLNHCVFTADLNDLPLFTQLDLICNAINARYETRGTNIFINGKGCVKE